MVAGEFVEMSTVGDVLAQRCLVLVRGVDGREADPVTIALLQELASIAGALCLPDADRFATLAAAAASGHTRDLERAALTIL